MSFDASHALLTRARKAIPSASQTFSKGPNQWAEQVSPYYLERGEGAWVWDVDGNKFLDHVMALGPMILGYGNEAVNRAVREQLDQGPVFSQMHPLEVEVAEALIELIPCAEMARFGKNGSDVTSAAIRVARAFTGRDRVAICGYHGWHDWYIGTTTRQIGIPQAVCDLSHTFNYNDIDSLVTLFDQHPGEFAAVIMEPIGIIEPEDGFLEKVKDATERAGAVLVFDEIVSGFRVSMNGAQSYYGVTPDLCCLGKAMANGMPLSAVVGRADIMALFDDIFFSGTFNGETLSLAACLATIKELNRIDAIDGIWRYGNALLAGMRDSIEKHGMTDVVLPVGQGVRSVLTFPNVEEEDALVFRTYFMQECVKERLLYFCLHMPSAAHGDEELAFTLTVFDQAMEKFAEAHRSNTIRDKLLGDPVQAIFRKP